MHGDLDFEGRVCRNQHARTYTEAYLKLYAHAHVHVHMKISRHIAANPIPYSETLRMTFIGMN